MIKLTAEKVIDGVEHVLVAVEPGEDKFLESKILFSLRPLKQFPIWGMDYELSNCYWIPSGRMPRKAHCVA